MGTGSYDLLRTVLFGFLGVIGICTAIAFIVSIVRYFIYDSSEVDTRPIKSKWINVFGVVIAIGLIVGGGSGFADSLMKNQVSQDISQGAGSSMAPEHFKDNTHYGSLGEALDKVAQSDPGYIAEQQARQEEENRAQSNSESIAANQQGIQNADSQAIKNTILSSITNSMGGTWDQSKIDAAQQQIDDKNKKKQEEAQEKWNAWVEEFKSHFK